MKVDDGRPGLRVVEHAPCVPFDAFRGLEFAGAGRPEELLVRHRVPEEVRQPRGELPPIESRGFRGVRLQLEVERRGLKDAGDGERHRFTDRFRGDLRLPESLDPTALSFVQRPAVRPLGEAEDARRGTGLALRGRQVGPARAVEEGRREQGEGPEVHPGEVEFLDLVGGRTLALCNALEAVGTGLVRKWPRPRVGRRRWREHALAGGAPRADPVGDSRALRPSFPVSGEAQQVGDRVVVLGRRKRQGRRFACLARFFRFSGHWQREGGSAKGYQDRPELDLHGVRGGRLGLRYRRTCNTVSVPSIPGRERVAGPPVSLGLARRGPTCAG